MSRIRTLKRNVTQEQAARQLGGSLWRKLRLGRLQALAEVYLPFRVYQVCIENRGKTETRYVALESVAGTLDLYGLDSLPEDMELVEVETRNHPDATLNDERGREIVIDHVRRMLFTNGFFRLRRLNIIAEPLQMEIHVPYWIGLFGSRERLKLVALDAVRRQVEGGKAVRLFEQWLQGSAA